MSGDSGKLGFRYALCDASMIDADDYRALLRSGKLSSEEAVWLRQFLREYCGKQTKAQNKLSSEEQRKSNRQRAAERERELTTANEKDVAASLAPKRARNRHECYEPQDYNKLGSDLTPEELLIILEENDEWP